MLIPRGPGVPYSQRSSDPKIGVGVGIGIGIEMDDVVSNTPFQASPWATLPRSPIGIGDSRSPDSSRFEAKLHPADPVCESVGERSEGTNWKDPVGSSDY